MTGRAAVKNTDFIVIIIMLKGSGLKHAYVDLIVVTVLRVF